MDVGNAKQNEGSGGWGFDRGESVHPSIHKEPGERNGGEQR